MFQDIDPHTLAYRHDRTRPTETDHVFFVKDGRVLLEADRGRLTVPTYGEVGRALPGGPDGLIYLFSVGDTAYYACLEEVGDFGRFAYRGIRVVRDLRPPLLAFASATAFHIADWYDHNRYCGHCAAPMLPKEGERALRCPGCGLVKYPRISPVVIVGITDGESLLLARNERAEYANYGLIAGFVEPGETLEAAMAREVMEEVGLAVGGARYYKSQPWAFSQSILMGFFAEVQGDRAITLAQDELTEARWFHRSELPADAARFSLTWDMIQAFRNREV